MSSETGINQLKPVILVLRPEHQAASTIAALQHNNWQTMHFPTVDISDHPALDTTIVASQLADTDWVFFISRNAVNYFFKHFDMERLSGLNIAAVGNATADALQQAGISVTLKPAETFTSEALLDSPQLSNMKGKHVLIIRGNGGREHLAQSLAQRGAHVEYVEVYQRKVAEQDCQSLVAQWPQVNIILATSNQLLDNLLLLCEKTIGAALFEKTLLVISERMVQHAHQLGFDTVWLAPTASDEAVVETIKKNTVLSH